MGTKQAAYAGFCCPEKVKDNSCIGDWWSAKLDTAKSDGESMDGVMSPDVAVSLCPWKESVCGTDAANPKKFTYA